MFFMKMLDLIRWKNLKFLIYLKSMFIWSKKAWWLSLTSPNTNHLAKMQVCRTSKTDISIV